MSSIGSLRGGHAENRVPHVSCAGDGRAHTPLSFPRGPTMQATSQRGTFARRAAPCPLTRPSNGAAALISIEQPEGACAARRREVASHPPDIGDEHSSKLRVPRRRPWRRCLGFVSLHCGECPMIVTPPGCGAAGAAATGRRHHALPCERRGAQQRATARSATAQYEQRASRWIAHGSAWNDACYTSRAARALVDGGRQSSARAFLTEVSCLHR